MFGSGRATFLGFANADKSVDEVLIPDNGRGTPVFILLLEKNGFNSEEEDVMSQITRKSRMIVINSPNNPPGRSYRMVIWQS